MTKEEEYKFQMNQVRTNSDIGTVKQDKFKSNISSV